MASFQPVRSVQRALAVLRAISESGPVTITDIVNGSGLPQPTVVRIIETLVASGYVYRQPGKATYKVTGSTLAFSRGFDPYPRFVELATPLIDSLHLEIGWPSNLTVFDGDAMVIVHGSRSLRSHSIPERIRQRIPMLATSPGRVTLADMSLAERRAVLRRAKASGSRWDNDLRLMINLDDRLRKVKRDGHAFADEEYLEAIYQSRIWGVAVPIPAPGGVRTALSSLILRTAGPQREVLAKILPRLYSTAAKMSRLLHAEYGSDAR